MKQILFIAMLAVLSGCMTAELARTNPDGSRDELKLHSFLTTIKDGNYTSGNGLSLSVSDATPDQKSIEILAGSVTDLAKMAVYASRPPTNTVSTNAP